MVPPLVPDLERPVAEAGVAAHLPSNFVKSLFHLCQKPKWYVMFRHHDNGGVLAELLQETFDTFACVFPPFVAGVVVAVL